MKISKTVKLGLSIALVTMFVGCGDTDDESKDTSNGSSNNSSEQNNNNSNVETNNNEVNSNNLEEETRIKPSTTPFIVKMKTENKYAGNEISINTATNDSNYTIDWGDGTSDNEVSKSKTHTYPNEGIYTITISGIYPTIGICPVSIEQWGDMQWSSMGSAFFSCNDIVFNASDTPNLSKVTSMGGMFQYSNFNGDISSWDVSNVTYMANMFDGNKNFNQDISSWDVSNVTDMKSMFSHTNSFNGDISSWDVSNVTNMSSMFSYANSFNQDIGSWDVSNVTDMSFMFSNTNSFNQDINSWNISNVTKLNAIFYQAQAFNQDISSWDISKIGGVISLEDSNLSTINYDKMLINWLNSDIQDNLTLVVGNTKYSKEAQSARFQLINKHNWDIRDGGLAN